MLTFGVIAGERAGMRRRWAPLRAVPGLRRDGPKPQGPGPRGSSFGKEPKQKPRGSGTPGTPVMNQQGAADMMAFGPSRHRAWFLGEKPFGCLMGSCGRRLKASWRTFGGLLGGSWGPLGASSWGASWKPLGGLLGVGGSWGLLGP